MRFRSLTVTLAIAFLAVCTMVLMLFTFLDVYFDLHNQKIAIADRQQRIAQAAANTVRSFVQEKLRVLEATVRLSNLAQIHPGQQKVVLERLLGIEKAFRYLKLFKQEHELISVSRLSKSIPLHVTDEIARDMFTQVSRGKTYVSTVYVDEVTSEPMVILAVSVTDLFGDCKGALIAEANLKFMWDLVGQIKVGSKGVAYVVDNQGNLIASGDVCRVLRGENLIHLKEVNKFVGGDYGLQEETFNISKGIDGTHVVSTYVPLSTPGWAVVIELPVLEAYGPIVKQLGISALIMLLVLIMALFAGNYLAKRISEPIINLRDATRRISRGDFSARTKIESEDEIGELASSFNEMTKNLQVTTTSIGNLKREVGERKRVEVALRESEERYRTQFEEALDAMFIADAETGTLLDCNQAGAELVGREKSELVGKHQRILHPPEEVKGELSRTFKQHLKKKQGQALETQVITKNGKTRDVAIKANMLELKGRKVLQGIFRDITDQKLAEEETRKLEAQLQRAEKMEVIGTLAGGVAHDLNNVLSGLVSYPELLLLDLPEDSPLRAPILTMQNSGKKAAAIVQDLLTLARRGVTATEVTNLNDIIRDYLISPEHEKVSRFHSRVEFETKLESDLLDVLGSTIHLSKTIMNLISNAAEAVPNGGHVTISTKNKYIDKPIAGYDDVKEGDYVVLTVKDDGPGITASDLKRIFEPFYTKKVMGRSGTGLGLAVVWGTVKDHNGYIDVQSTEGKGTTFDLYFPVTRKEKYKTRSVRPINHYMGDGENILVVDDVREQREIAIRLLTKLGYAVEAAANGEEAIAFMQTHSADLLVLDMIMDPGIDGLDTYKKILELHPGQRAIIASGFSETERVREAQRLGAGQYVKKPYTLEKMGLAVKTELEKLRSRRFPADLFARARRA